MNKMMAAAEVGAEKGNVDGSKFKAILAHEIKDKMKELEEKYTVTYTVTHRGEEVCEICGTRYEALIATNHARHAAHFQARCTSRMSRSVNGSRNSAGSSVTASLKGMFAGAARGSLESGA